MTPISVCEVVIRNAVDEALTALHGTNWPSDHGFYLTLPRKGREQLDDARNKPTWGHLRKRKIKHAKPKNSRS